MKNESIDNLTDEDKKVYYVTRLERLDKNYFKAAFATVASLVVELGIVVYGVLDYLEKNQYNPIPGGFVPLFMWLVFLFNGKAQNIDIRRKEIYETLINDGKDKAK